VRPCLGRGVAFDIRGRTVAEAVAMLKRHKISVAFYRYESRPGYFGSTKDPRKIPGAWYVSGADPFAPGQVQLAVQWRKPGHAEDDAYYHQMLKGCH
jgi:ribosomal protein L22